MFCLRKNKYHIAAALLTAVLLCPGSENFNKNSNLLAWWGTIYPQFCFMEAPRTEGQKQARTEQVLRSWKVGEKAGNAPGIRAQKGCRHLSQNRHLLF